MSKKHDERKDLASITRVGKIDYGNKTIIVNKSRCGIHRLGMLDYLTRYCGWFVGFSNKPKPIVDSDSKSSREIKREKKEHKLKDKRK